MNWKIYFCFDCFLLFLYIEINKAFPFFYENTELHPLFADEVDVVINNKIISIYIKTTMTAITVLHSQANPQLFHANWGTQEKRDDPEGSTSLTKARNWSSSVLDSQIVQKEMLHTFECLKILESTTLTWTRSYWNSLPIMTLRPQ